MKFIKSLSKSPLTDGELIGNYCQTGDQRQVTILFDRYTHLVFGVCMKYLKEEDASKDATMQIFEKLFEDLCKQEIIQFKSWLYTVAKNHCLMYLRKQQTGRSKQEDYKNSNVINMELSPLSHHEEVADKEIQLDALEEGIKQLNAEQKKCIELFYLQEKSYQETAEITRYSLGEVKSYIQNGKRNLKNYLIERKVQSK